MSKKTKYIVCALMLSVSVMLIPSKVYARKFFGTEKSDQKAYVGGSVCWTVTNYFMGIKVGERTECEQLVANNQ